MTPSEHTSTSGPLNATDPDSRRLDMRGVSKAFGESVVLNDVDLAVAPGEIHGLLGQNGAGKSTLMKILGGVHRDWSGSIAIDGQPVHPETPRGALDVGVGVIYQELSLVRNLTVAENIVLGGEPGRVAYRKGAARARAVELLSTVGMEGALPLDAVVGSLSAGIQQRVEIAKALVRQAKILVMDEPTARLSAPERVQLFHLMREVAATGSAIVFISHFLEEVLEATQRVTILRNGRVVATGQTADFDVHALEAAMLGRELLREEEENLARDDHDGRVILEARGVTAGSRLRNVSIALRERQVVGLAGLVGSGRTRLARTLVGAEKIDGGTIELLGRPARFRSPLDARRAGVVMVPEDRKTQGIVSTQSAIANLTLMALDGDLSRWGLVRNRARRRAGIEQLNALEVRPARGDLSASSFSGGNQQKLLMGRALLAKPRVLITDQPTAGVDVGTKAQIHRILRKAAANGAAVLVISDDLEELVAVSDRILIMRAGTIVSATDRAEMARGTLLETISSDRPVAAV